MTGKLWIALLVIFLAGGAATLRCYLDGTIPRIRENTRRLKALRGRAKK